MSKTDKELLELAAKAGNIDFDKQQSKQLDGQRFFGLWLVLDGEPNRYTKRYWNPLTDDGEALRLAVNLGLKILIDLDGAETRINNEYDGLICLHKHFDIGADYATRRAIVRAAAAIGESMQ